MTQHTVQLPIKKKRIKVTAAVIERNNKVLIAQRALKGASGGKWEFPGGKIENDETPEDCLKREILEELGVVIKPGAFICSNTFNYEQCVLELIAYRANYVSGDFILHVHDDMKWVHREELDNYDFPEADIPVIKAIQSDCITD